MSEINHKPDCIDQSTCEGMIRARDRIICEQAWTIAELRTQIDELLSGCGSHSCKVQRPYGQGVNGPCRCVEKLRAARGEEVTR